MKDDIIIQMNNWSNWYWNNCKHSTCSRPGQFAYTSLRTGEIVIAIIVRITPVLGLVSCTSFIYKLPMAGYEMWRIWKCKKLYFHKRRWWSATFAIATTWRFTCIITCLCVERKQQKRDSSAISSCFFFSSPACFDIFPLNVSGRDSFVSDGVSTYSH